MTDLGMLPRLWLCVLFLVDALEDHGPIYPQAGNRGRRSRRLYFPLWRRRSSLRLQPLHLQGLQTDGTSEAVKSNVSVNKRKQMRARFEVTVLASNKVEYGLNT